jgi:hypothetical protein
MSIAITVGGKTQSVMEWSKELGLNFQSVYRRLKKGMDPARALTLPMEEGCVKHGHFRRSKGIRTRAHMTWTGIKSRCLNPRNKQYPEYGGRGISVCERWYKFEDFFADMGTPPENMTLERIDNSGPYSPDNCVWATRKTQANNKRSCIYVSIDGVTKTVSQWCELTGVNRMTAYTRIKRGWNPVDAVTAQAA